MKKSYIFFGLIFFYSLNAFAKYTYLFKKEPIDVVIPCHKKDRENLDKAIISIRQHVSHVRDVYTISKEAYTSLAIWVPEEVFPFTKESIASEIFRNKSDDAINFLQSPKQRICWLFQQLIKLYAPYIIPGVSSNVLIWDADLIVNKSINFVNEQGAAIFDVSEQFYEPYFVHLRKLLGLKKVFPQFSGITNHMLFQRCVLDDLFRVLKEHHGCKEVWKILCHAIDLNEINHSAMSEYELYFNFCFMKSDQFEIRRSRNIEVVHGALVPSDAHCEYITYHIRYDDAGNIL